MLRLHTCRSEYVTGARHISSISSTAPSAAFLLRDRWEAVQLRLVKDTSPSLANGNTHTLREGERVKITDYKSKLLATAYQYIKVTDSDSTYQSHLLAFPFACMSVPKLTFFYKTKGNASLWTKCSREDYTLLFFQQPLPPVLPFPHSPFSLANVSAPSLPLCPLSGFILIKLLLPTCYFCRNPLLLSTQRWIPTACSLGVVTSCDITCTGFTWSAKKKEAHAHID